MIYPLTAPMMDFLILSIICHQDSYGYQISQQLKCISNITDSALYPVLRRLSDNGYVDTYDQPFQGRNRKYYHITPTGRLQQQTLLEAWRSYCRTVEQLIDEGNLPRNGEKHESN